MPAPSSLPDGVEHARTGRPGPSTPAPDRRRGGRLGLVPVALATVVTLVLGGASVARALEAPPLDAHTDLEFSLDGVNWVDAPDPVLGTWGCDLVGGAQAQAPTQAQAATQTQAPTPAQASVPEPSGAVGGTPGVDPCAMSPGESVDRTYHVRNATSSGRAGRYEVGVGDFEVSELAEFSVTTTIDGGTAADSHTVTLFGDATDQSPESPVPGSTVASVELAPGQSARVVDRVSVPEVPANYEQGQSVSPRIWVSFTGVDAVDTDGDGLPDDVEDQLGTDPGDRFNQFPDATAGRDFGPEPFLPTAPDGTVLDVDPSSLPAGMRLEDGALTGTPSRPGVYDVPFTVTLPDGTRYDSVRRVVVGSGPGGGSVGLPDLGWPIVVVGVIGLILGPGLGAFVGSAAGSAGSAWGSGGSSGAASGPGSTPGAGSTAGAGSAPVPDDESAEAEQTPAGPSPGAGAGADGGPATGTVPAESVTHTPREGAPSSEWVRANSEVRGSLPRTGVAVADLVLWALTAAAAGATVLLIVSRRRDRDCGDRD